MKINDNYVSCPKCGWEPNENDIWVCDECRTRWNTFQTRGKCPGCAKEFKNTQCVKHKGGCGQMSLHSEWYEQIVLPNPREKKKFSWFWQRKIELPITEEDKEWLDHDLLWLAELFTPEVFRSLVTITPDKQYFNYNFTGLEKDVDFIFQTVAGIMNIKPWEIQLMFFSDKPTKFSAGITATPSDGLHDRWKSKESEFIDNGFGNKEIWIDMSQINDPIGLIATISTELAKYKLKDEYAITEDIAIIADLTSIVFGFGIFKGNSYFKFAQWTGASHQGWQMKKRGGLPEPVIAYVMAWLAYYRDEDVSWKQYLNRTMKKYFEKSYSWIEQNKDWVKWNY